MYNAYIPSYLIKSNSTLYGMIPIYEEGEVKAITNVFKKGTSNNSSQIATTGKITFEVVTYVPEDKFVIGKSRVGEVFNSKNQLLNSYTSNASNGTLTNDRIVEHSNYEAAVCVVKFIKFIYKASTRTGNDSFEFTINYKDGRKVLQQINVDIIKNEDDLNYQINYVELFCDKNLNTVNYDIKLSDLDFYTTRGMFSLSNSEFLIDKFNNGIDRFNKDISIEGPVSNVVIKGLTTINTTVGLAGNINYIETISLTFNKSLEKYKYNEYAKIKLYSSVDLAGIEVPKKITYNFIFHQTDIGDDYNLMEEIFVEPFSYVQNPNFIKTDIEYPEAPNIEANYAAMPVYTDGDMLSNTRPHKALDKKGNKTIKLGNTVPKDAVNLAYYYNATSSLKDTISVIETNTNTVTLHYIEDWVHKYSLSTNSDENFLDYIEFEGKKGTYLEGFWGLLYRDYIMWEEEPLIDQNPEWVTVYEKFFGLHTMNIPQGKYHKNGTKSGMLELSHSIYTAIDFKRSKVEGVKYEPSRWKCLAKYEGMIKDTKVQYNGSARYSGIVTKKDGMSNLEPDKQKELVMFPDERGILHLQNGEQYVDDDLFYITDKFKEEVPLYYKHRLKFRIYDSIGPDNYGAYNTENIKLVTESHMPINENVYKYKVEVKATEFKNVYDAYIYTSFIPSIENPIYAMYNGLSEGTYESTNNVNPLDVKVGILERLSVIPAFDTDEYFVEVRQGLTQKSIITVKNPQILYDLREKVDIEYIVSAEGVSTPPIPAKVINKKFAIYNELQDFKNNDMIVSSKNTSGYMTAKDILFKYATEEEKLKIKNDSIFKVSFNTSNPDTLYNKDKVILFTDPDGKGLIYSRTYLNTGMPSETGDKNKVLDTSSIYISNGTNIYKGYGIKCRNINQIVISAPSENDPLKGWYPRIRYSYFDKAYERTDGSMQLIYSVPEFNTQVFGKYGKPYIDINNEKARFIGSNTIKVKHLPMYIKIDRDGNILTINAYKKMADGTNRELVIKSHNFEHGLVEFEDKLSENDDIYVSYTYEEQYYHYKGYYNNFDKNTPLLDLNLNPIVYNTFTDTANEMFSRKNSFELFNRTIHFFLRPMRIIDKVTGEVQSDNNFTIYHKFDNQEALGPFDLHIGRIFVRHHASLQSTVLLDTRYRGGGVIEGMKDELRKELEPESDYYLDIGTLDGKPYQENSILVVRIDNRILKSNGGVFTEEEVKTAVEKWSAYGTYHIIEFVEIIENSDMPQNTMVVNRHISNQIKYKPHFTAQVVDYNYNGQFIIGKSIIGVDSIHDESGGFRVGVTAVGNILRNN